MPLTKPAFFQSDRLPKWRAVGLGAWIWLRLRYRHNPGFFTATIAGSIGLVLTLLLLLNGGFGFFGTPKANEPEVATTAELGDAGELPPKKTDVPAGLVGFDDQPERRPTSAVSNIRSRTQSDWAGDAEPALPQSRPGKPASERLVSQSERPAIEEEPLLGDEPAKDAAEPKDEPATNDESDSSEPPRIRHETQVATKFEPPVIENKEEDDQKSEDDRGTLSADEPLLGGDEPVRKVDETPPARTKPSVTRLPILAEDEEQPADKSETPQPAQSQTQVTTVVTAAPATKSIDDEPTAADDGAFIQPQPKSSWKDSKAKPLPPVKEPNTGSATQSRAVETAVYATPEPKQEPKQELKPARDPESKEPRRLTLSIRAPRYIAPGETFDVDFVVTNTSRQTLEGATLSVNLPAGLVHPQGASLEQSIGSLAGCQTYRGRLKVKALDGGEAVLRADVSIDGRVGAQSSMPLCISTRREARSNRFDPSCACDSIRIIR